MVTNRRQKYKGNLLRKLLLLKPRAWLHRADFASACFETCPNRVDPLDMMAA